jgi:N-acetylglucosamine kinase-like BadF-type ATPase
VDPEPLLLAIDGGQTATKSLIARLDGSVLGQGRGGPSDHFHIEGGVEKNRIAIQGAIASVLHVASVNPRQVAAIALCLTGAPTAGDQTAVVETIVREVLDPEHITITPDYVTNLAGASGGEPGVVMIAGGGAISYGITADGREALAGGYGFLVGDEGSAFNIGLMAIRAATRSADLREEPTALEKIVREHLGIQAIRDIPRVVYQAGCPREVISLLTPKVARAAREGDPVAGRIMQSAGEELGLTAIGTIRQLFEPGTPVDVFLTGGVFSAGDIVLDPFHAMLHKGWPEARPLKPRFPPVVGTLILAARSLDRAVDPHWLNAVARTMERVRS